MRPGGNAQAVGEGWQLLILPTTAYAEYASILMCCLSFGVAMLVSVVCLMAASFTTISQENASSPTAVDAPRCLSAGALIRGNPLNGTLVYLLLTCNRPSCPRQPTEIQLGSQVVDLLAVHPMLQFQLQLHILKDVALAASSV